MSLPPVDWLMIWKLYHYPFFFGAYMAVGFAIRFPTLRRLNSASPTKTWLLSTSASLLILPVVPLLALPSFALVALLAGKIAASSFLMAIPIALSLAFLGCLVDGILLRIMLREAVGRERMRFLFGTNLLISLLAIGAVVALMLLHPIEVIAKVLWLATIGDFTQNAGAGL